MPKVSIIVPIYNAASTIENCLKSISEQEFRNFEVICVDDGSTDTSQAIISQISKYDERIKVLKVDHGGRSWARNNGLKLAQGEWIMFVDADDELYSNRALSSLLGVANGYDAVVGEINVVDPNGIGNSTQDENYYSLKFSGEIRISEKVLEDFHCSVCGCLFRKSIIENKSLKFPNGINYEDAYWHWTFFSRDTKTYFLRDKIYNYIRRPGSIMSKTFQSEGNYSIDHLFICDEIFKFNNSLLNDEAKRNLLEKYFLLAYKFSNKKNKLEVLFVCSKLINKHFVKTEGSQVLEWVYRGDIENFFFKDKENERIFSDYLKIIRISEKLFPRGSLRYKIVYKILRRIAKSL